MVDNYKEDPGKRIRQGETLSELPVTVDKHSPGSPGGVKHYS